MKLADAGQDTIIDTLFGATMTQTPSGKPFPELTQVQTVYPGHPVTIAYFILRTFSSPDAANKRGENFKAALTHKDIPGAGGCVHAALDFLDRAHVAGIENALTWARERWLSETSDGYKDKRDPGQAEADMLTPYVRELFEAWPAPEPVSA